MAKYAIDSTTLTGIADAIREKAGTTATIATNKMAEAILAIKGGLSVDVVTASSLPATVTDGQIVVITDTTPGTVYIDTDEPASPADGDVWVKLEAEATVKLELTEESPYLRGGLTAAAQWDGSAWEIHNAYMGVAGEWVKFSDMLPPIGTALNDCTWEQISKIAASGKARDYFSVGDAKRFIINGTVGNTTFDNLYVWAFILDYDHNPTYEESNTIHFQIGKTAQADGTDICLIDSKYNTTVTSAGYFSMNTSGTNSGGWGDSYMRTVVLGSSYEPAAPPEGSLLAALPSDLRSVMKVVTKYTDNTGGGADTAERVTSTKDCLWLLSEWEVFGSRSSANSTEQDYQQQYEYYASGNSKKKFKHNSQSEAAAWRLRSPDATTTTSFCFTSLSAAASTRTAETPFGLSPAFAV